MRCSMQHGRGQCVLYWSRLHLMQQLPAGCHACNGLFQRASQANLR